LLQDLQYLASRSLALSSHRSRLYAALDGVEQERTTPESRILLYKRVQRRRGSITLSTALSLNEHLSRLTSVENSIVIVIDTYKAFYLCIFQLMIFMAGTSRWYHHYKSPFPSAALSYLIFSM